MRNTYDDDEIERIFNLINEEISKYFNSIHTFIQELSDDDIIEFSEYIRYIYKSHSKKNPVNMDKVKIFISLFKLSNYDAKTILSYLDSIEYGWHNNEYILRNPCLSRLLYSSHKYCKRKYPISNVDEATILFNNIYEIFLDKNYGKITLFIFSYCLVALFSTKLNQNRNTIPFFLQIACERNSTLYQLIIEIVEICDVNAGLIHECPNIYEYTLCGYTHQIFNPTQNTEKGLDDLIYNNKDIPVIIDGYENERYYSALLREISNIPSKRNNLDLRDKFNFLPLFLCPIIKSSFNNVFDIDLTDFEISKEYLTLLRKNKKILATWVLDLVLEYKNCLFPNLDNYDKPRKYPFISEIRTYINYVGKKYSDLARDCAENIGFLSFFFKGFTRVFQRLFTFPLDEKFAVSQDSNGTPLQNTGQENIAILNEEALNKLIELHRYYFPSPKESNIKDKEAIRLARQIEKEYKKFRVFICVSPIDVQEDRYVFEVNTLQNTKDTDIKKNIETVQRRLKKYECFRVDLSDKKSIKLIVAEKSLKDSNLLKLLKCGDFKDSKKKIPYAIGFDETGAPCIRDITGFPHLLIAGTTQSGKSTAMMSLLISIAYKHQTGNVNVLIMDFLGKLESDFAIFNDQPFLACPVINDPLAGRNAILALHREAHNRLKNKNLPDMPYIVCVIDEFPRLFQNISNKAELNQLETIINDLLSTGRHSKIDFVIAVQNPTKANMRCGIANLSTKIALKCSHYQNSKTILGRSGAEKLIGKGQMIFNSSDEQDKRIQGSYIKVNDINKLLSIIKQSFKQQNEYPFKLDMELISYSSELDKEIFDNQKIFQHNSDDEKVYNAIMWSLSKPQIANYRLQKYLKSGNNVTKRILKRMEEFNLIVRLHGNLGWEVVPKCIEDMSANAIEFLKAHGNTENSIKNAFVEELNESDIQINTKQEQNSQTVYSINDMQNYQLNDTVNKQAESRVVKDTEDTKNISDINDFTQHPNATVKKINLKDKTKADKVLSKISKKNKNSPKNYRSNKKKEPAD